MLRIVTWTLLAAQSAYWLAAMAFGTLYATGGDGGLQWLAGLFATPPFVLLTLPGIVLATRGRRPLTALALALVGVVAVPFLVLFDLWATWTR